MSKDIGTVSREINRLEVELAKLKEQKAKFDNLPDDKRLATFIHDNFCHSDPPGCCGWYDEEWKDGSDPVSWTKVRYLSQARKILEFADYRTAFNVLTVFRDGCLPEDI